MIFYTNHPKWNKTVNLYKQRKFQEAETSLVLIINEYSTSNDVLNLIEAKLFFTKIKLNKLRYKIGSESFDDLHSMISECFELDKLLKETCEIKILLVKSDIYIIEEKFEQATTILDKVIEATEFLNVDNKYNNFLIDAWFNKSRISERLNQYKEAFDCVGKMELYLVDLVDENTKLDAELKYYYQLSQLSVKKQEYVKLLDYSKSLLTLSKKLGDIEKEVVALSNIGIAHGVKSEYKEAMQCFLESLEKSEKINFRYNIANCQINIGTIYAHLFNYDDALERYQNVLKTYKDALNINTIISVQNNIGNIYFNKKQNKNALVHYKDALLKSEISNFEDMHAYMLAQCAKVYIALEEYDNAYEDSKKAKSHFDKIGKRLNGIQINASNLSSLALFEGDYDTALKLALSSIASSARLKDIVSELRGYKLIAEIYQKKKDYQKGFKAHSKYTELQEDYNRSQRTRQITDLEIKHSIKDKQRQIETLKKENQLQSLLLERNSQIAKQNELLENVNEELRQFAYIASHDLKEPLRMIGSFTQLIQRKYYDGAEEDFQTYFNFITDGVKRMNNLLDALLQYATIGIGENDDEYTDLNKVIETCLINLSPIIHTSNAKIIVENQLPTVKVATSLMTQLFQNLIANAIKFRKENIPPIIKIGVSHKGNENLIYVKDNGIGIDPEQAERVFVIFQRLHSREKYEGTGIGLAVCQKIVLQLGGKIWVQSELGKGSTFFLTLHP
jgi:signal transduction histidine kinase